MVGVHVALGDFLGGHVAHIAFAADATDPLVVHIPRHAIKSTHSGLDLYFDDKLVMWMDLETSNNILVNDPYHVVTSWSTELLSIQVFAEAASASESSPWLPLPARCVTCAEPVATDNSLCEACETACTEMVSCSPDGDQSKVRVQQMPNLRSTADDISTTSMVSPRA